MSNLTTRSHYLPQTYLKHFLLDNRLEMYKKGENFFKSNIKEEDRIVTVIGESGLKNIGVENNLYNPEVKGITSNDLEEIFQEYGENFYDELVNSVEMLQVGNNIPQEIKDKLCLFMASMRIRTPQFKNEVENMSTVFMKHQMKTDLGSMTTEEIIKFSKEELKQDITTETAIKVKDAFENGRYELKYPNNAFFIRTALLSLDHHADIFHQMTMNIIKSDRRYFITSDNPVVFFVPQEKVTFYDSPRSLVSRFSELFFPISNNIGVTLNWHKTDEKIMSAGREIVDIFNYNISHNSFNFIFSPIKMKSLGIFTKEFVPYPFEFKVN